ncbi:hypothetical protein [Streptomyces sp. NPDC002550]
MQDAAFRSEIARLYLKWQADPDGTDAKVRLLVTLALSSLVLDQPASTAESDWEQITTAEILEAVVARPVHELFASLPTLPPGDQGHVQALKLMSYGFGTSRGPSATVNYWAYLTTAVSLCLEHIATVTSQEAPTCAAVLAASR